MSEEQKAAPLAGRVLQALGVSLFATFFSGVAGIIAFWLGLFVFALVGMDQFISDGQMFSAIGFNVFPVAVAAGLASFIAQFCKARNRVLGIGHSLLVILILGAFVALVVATSYIKGDDAFLIEAIVVGAFCGVPCILTVLVSRWLVLSALSDVGHGEIWPSVEIEKLPWPFVRNSG
ncbi:hypothetical protein [Ensifer soli]|uniref:hypothetical protein n=1 Tax=Ciceribacter sp. sgz301302 TaxID=3342379 RepID=UPI0035B9430E